MGAIDSVLRDGKPEGIMNALSLIPIPDIIPAPAWIFLVLDILLFGLHILLINTALGSMLILLFQSLKRNEAFHQTLNRDGIVGKIPTLFALGINFGVAPLLFMQVIYGHLFYTSSVLMATYWILIIPSLISAYYGVYILAKRNRKNPLLSKAALWTAVFIVLLIGFFFVNNMTLMVQPEKWNVYFENRGGTLLNISDATLIPRYLHFVTASLAVGGLFIAFLAKWHKARGRAAAPEKIGFGLKIFGYATIAQVLIGLWFLISIPQKYMLNFLGGEPLFTIILLAGVGSGIGAAAAALAEKLYTAGALFMITLGIMIVTRHNLRSMYLDGKFSLATLTVHPQYGVMALFLGILVAGIFAVIFMAKLASSAGHGRVT